MRRRLMTKKVYPNLKGVAPSPGPGPNPLASDEPMPMVVLTVWKKSLVLNCDGYTVFDSHGNLVYRVENYRPSSSSADEIFLMDAHGNSLLTIRRRRLKKLIGRLVGGDRRSWSVYEGETADNPKYSVIRQNSTSHTKWGPLAHVIGANPNYEIEGCYGRQRCCAVYDEKRRPVVEMKPKETSVKGAAFGADVFRLLVHQEFDTALAMAIVILLDHF